MKLSLRKNLKASVKSLLRVIPGHLGYDIRQSDLDRDPLWAAIAAASFVKKSGVEVKDTRPLLEQMPQSGVSEHAYIAYEERDWRGSFVLKLAGKGIEIGPLHRPLAKHDGMQVEYMDRCTVAELRAHYPELAELPLVEPDIISDAQVMGGISDAAYDFVVASHVIEHMRNPIKAMSEWVRVLKPGGYLYMIVPDKRAIFDRTRVRTTLEHIMLDYLRPSLVRDYEHFLDYAVHVNRKKGEAALENADALIAKDYSIHFHVFLPTDIMRMCEWFAKHVCNIEIIEGPVGAPSSDEFHLLIQKI